MDNRLPTSDLVHASDVLIFIDSKLSLKGKWTSFQALGDIFLKSVSIIFLEYQTLKFLGQISCYKKYHLIQKYTSIDLDVRYHIIALKFRMHWVRGTDTVAFSSLVMPKNMPLTVSAYFPAFISIYTININILSPYYHPHQYLNLHLLAHFSFLL